MHRQKISKLEKASHMPSLPVTAVAATLKQDAMPPISQAYGLRGGIVRRRRRPDRVIEALKTVVDPVEVPVRERRLPV